MPIPIIYHGVAEGISAIPYVFTILKAAAVVTVVALLKYFFGGARNTSVRLMHSKVVMVTGGTSGIGAAVVYDLASRGAQIILLTQHAPTDLFLVDYIEDLRHSTGNELIYAEQVDLTSLHSIRTFATKWVDNAPPRRLDMIILCANTLKPSGGNPPRITPDGLDEEWQVNYLANFHLLSILSPAIRAQPPDRDVRVIFSTCSSYIGGTIDLERTEGALSNGKKSTKRATSKASASEKKKKKSPSSIYGMTKLSLMIFAQAFQKHLSAYKRPDQQPMNARVLVVDPGFSRTPGTRRWITGGSLWGLFLYLITWPFWWLVLKSPQQGAQTFLYAAMEAQYGRREAKGGWLLKECREIEYLRNEVKDEQLAKQLWEFSEVQIQEKEKEAATKRALAKKEQEEAKKKETETTKENKADTTAASSKNSSTSSSATSSSGKTQTAASRRNKKANK